MMLNMVPVQVNKVLQACKPKLIIIVYGRLKKAIIFQQKHTVF